MQNYEDGFIIRYFSGAKEYKKHYRNPTLEYSEYIREIYTFNGKSLNVKKYEYGWFFQTGGCRWCEDSSKYKTPKTYLYTRNLKRILEGTRWQYSCMYDFAKAVNQLYVGKFLEEYLKHPQIEYLIKFKLYRFVDEKLSTFYTPIWNGINFEGRNIKEVFDIEKELFLQMQRLDLDSDGLRLIKKAVLMLNKVNALTDSQVKWIVSNVQTNHFCEMLKYSTPHKIIKYVQEQSSKKYEPNDVLADWCDYIRQCKDFKFDIENTFVLYPKNLKERHDEYMIMNKSKGLSKYDKKVKKAFEVLNKCYSYSDKKFTIRPANGVNEIVGEGHKLRHCVGQTHYIDGMAKGDRAIMVVRKVSDPDTPFFTLELNLNQISVSQCRGYKNCGMTEEVKKFIDKWKKTKLTEEMQKVV